MKWYLRLLQWLAVFIISMLLLLNILVISLMVVVKVNVLNADFYKTEFEKYGVYDKFIDFATDTFAGSINKEQKLSDKDYQELKQKLHNVFAQSELKPQIEANIDSFFNYVNGKSTYFNFVINATPAKTAIVKEFSEQTGQNLSAEQFQQIPDTIDLMETGQFSQLRTFADEARSGIFLFDMIFIGAIVLFCILTGLLFLVCWNLRSAVRKTSSMLIISAISIWLPLQMFFAKAAMIVQQMFPQLSPEQMAQLQNFVVPFLKDLLNPMIVSAIVLFIVGLVLFVLSFFIKKHEEKELTKDKKEKRKTEAEKQKEEGKEKEDKSDEIDVRKKPKRI